MKSLATVIALFYFASTMAAAPYGIKGQKQAATLYSNVHQFPNSQVTNMGGIDALVETGNTNILENPSFEHLTVSSGWTDSGTDTGIATAVAVIDGKKAIGFLPVARSVNLTQSSTLYANQFADGVQGLAMVRIKSDVAVKVCSIQAGTVSTTNCVTTNTDLKWGLYKVPFILGGTSNGISIASSGLVTGTVIVDNAFVGAVDLTQNITACLDVKCETDFSVTVGNTGTVIAESLDWVTSCTNTLGVVACTFVSNLTSSLSTGMTCVGNREGSSGGTMAVIGGSTTTTGFSFTSGNTTSNQTVYYCKKTGADYTAAKSRSNGNTYTSNNADTDWAACSFSSLAWQGLGTVTNTLLCKRQGGDLLIAGRINTGTATASIVQIPLPLWNGSQLTSAGSGKINTPFHFGGRVARNTITQNDYSALLLTSSTVFNIGVYNSIGANPFTALAGTSVVTSGDVLWLETVRIPIEGWNNSNIIIGSFNGLQTCTDTKSCTDTFSVDVSSTGVVTKENIDWINGNCTNSSAGVYSCPFNSGIFTVAPNCVSNGQLQGGTYATGSVGSADLAIRNTGGVLANGQFTLVCQKQGADYIGKTAMAVASDQNVRSIGSTGVDIQSVYFGSGANCATACTAGNCTICSQVGSKITSVSFVSTGNYNINGLDGTKYICNSMGNSSVSALVSPIQLLASSTTSYVRIAFYNQTPTLVNTYSNSLTCIGIP